jgi:hypothetical protein
MAPAKAAYAVTGNLFSFPPYKIYMKKTMYVCMIIELFHEDTRFSADQPCHYSGCFDFPDQVCLGSLFRKRLFSPGMGTFKKIGSG